MTPERWERVKQIVNACLEMEARERESYIAESCAGDPALRTEVTSLLASCESAGDFMETPALGREQADEPTGRRIGNYRIADTIAEGGMGAVYKAVRADDQYRKLVAVKLIRSGLNSEFIVRRFKAERQILANLDHPNIARLLDGGSTEDGNPYLVMEYVAGEPIDAYCVRRGLSVAERLQLFRAVCSAVQHAHQNLVIHRDLKPGNILVTEDGTPKLLDFGIAKILDPQQTEGEVTATIERMMTPEYASPEQLRGAPLTTATDVYSLGVVLYRMLTGRWPYRVAQHTLPEIAKAICEMEPERPSTSVSRPEEPEPGDETLLLTRNARGGRPLPAAGTRNGTREKLRGELEGDLDNILLKALRKEPERRYGSVEQLSEDLRRYLEGRPVLARKDTLPYRAGKFVKRHKAAAAASAVAAVALVAGVAATLREARIARKQAEVASAERARAERRFNDVRRLANSLIFEFHDAIQRMPAATEARRLLLTRALEYLDGLAKEAGGDVSLERELASAYQRVAQLQANSADANLGETEAGLASFQKALALWEAVAKASPAGAIDQLNVAFGHRLMSAMLSGLGRPGAREQIDQAMTITGRLLAGSADNPKVRSERAIECSVLAGLQQDSGDWDGALKSFREALSMKEALYRTNPSYPNVRPGIAVARIQLSDQLADRGEREEALKLNQSALDLLAELAKNGADARSRREWAMTTAKRGGILLRNGRPQEALSCFRSASAMFGQMAKADPENVLLTWDIATAALGTGTALSVSGNPEALHEVERAVKLLDRNREPDGSLRDPYSLAAGYVWDGDLLAKKSDRSGALASYRHAVEAIASFAGESRGEQAAMRARIAGVLASLGRREEAATEYREATKLAEALASAQPGNPKAWYALANVYFGMGEFARSRATPGSGGRVEWQQAREWYRKSAAAWSHVVNPAAVSPLGIECGSPQEAARAAALCDRALSEGPASQL